MNALPALPTDNLYKFCAIAGAAMVLIGAFGWYQAFRDYRAEARWFDDEWTKTKADIFWTQTLEKQQAEATRNWNESQLGAPTIMQDGLAIPRDRFWDYIKDVREKIEEGRRRNQELYSHAAKLGGLSDVFVTVSWIAGTAALFGLILAAYGFRNWRILQLKQDRLLEEELNERKAR